MALDEDTTPNTKEMAKKVYRGILKGDKSVLQAIQDCEDDDDIQESQEMVTTSGGLLFGVEE
jgi:hypothetical protein